MNEIDDDNNVASASQDLKALIESEKNQETKQSIFSVLKNKNTLRLASKYGE